MWESGVGRAGVVRRVTHLARRDRLLILLHRPLRRLEVRLAVTLCRGFGSDAGDRRDARGGGRGEGKDLVDDVRARAGGLYQKASCNPTLRRGRDNHTHLRARTSFAGPRAPRPASSHPFLRESPGSSINCGSNSRPSGREVQRRRELNTQPQWCVAVRRPMTRRSRTEEKAAEEMGAAFRLALSRAERMTRSGAYGGSFRMCYITEFDRIAKRGRTSAHWNHLTTGREHPRVQRCV
jgi:hypothetical protein